MNELGTFSCASKVLLVYDSCEVCNFGKDNAYKAFQNPDTYIRSAQTLKNYFPVVLEMMLQHQYLMPILLWELRTFENDFTTVY